MSSDVKSKQIELFFPDPFPALWASDWGEDNFGLWVAFTYKGVRQAFRWIAPGTFMMGSPASERDRDNNEIQHEVTLTEGYWLADTACNQALWQAVMDNNPSHFKENENYPVEQVSWHDVQGFIVALNAAILGLNAALPTEAQWEYACRAGTLTPYSFGGKITTDQVNCRARSTVSVGSLLANPWGLYEMHGNVREWCEDWYGDYRAEKEINPVGADKGASRVMRGGSWLDDGRDARSALRSRCVLGIAYHSIGFRLALGQGER